MPPPSAREVEWRPAAEETRLRVKKLICLSGVMLASVAAAGPAQAAPAAVTLSGAGSTLVAPLIAEWASQYHIFFGDRISYEAVGSPAGISALSSGAVDFGATDSPLTSAQRQSCSHCLQIPWALTAIAIGYHVASIRGKLDLSGRVLAGIYLGQITKWDDPRIKALNPRLRLPSLHIAPVYTNDSGDTYNFTGYLDRVSRAWRSKVGQGETVSFPAGISAHSSSGATALLESTNGAITFVGAAYLIRHRLPAAAIQNAAGHYEYPNLTNVKSAGASVVRVPAGNAIQIVDPPKSAKAAYPISAFSYVVVSRDGNSGHKPALKDWLTYATGLAQSYGQNLDFARLPPVVLRAARATVRSWSG